jgi:hypothetical protein
MGGREGRWLLPVLGAGIAAWCSALARAGAQVLDDAQLQQTVAIAALGFALGPWLLAQQAPSHEQTGTRREEAWAANAAALGLLIGPVAWLRVARALPPGFGATACAALLLALPLCVAGYAMATATASASRFGAALGAAGLGAAASPIAIELSGPDKVLAQTCLLVAALAVFAARAPVARRGDRLWNTSGLAFLLAFTAAWLAPGVLAVPEQPPPLGRASALREHMAERGLRLVPRADGWDGFGHLQAFELVDASSHGRGLGVLLRDSAVLAPLVRGESNASGALETLCEDTLLGAPYGRPRARVLLAGLGGGLELQCALRRGAQRIDVAEPSTALRAAISGPLDRFVGRIAHDARVHFHAVPARSLVRTAHGFDLVVLVSADHKHRLAAGVLPVAETLLPTDRGLSELITALGPEGVLSSIVVGEPEALRFASTAFSALRLLDEPKPENHIVVQQSGDAYAISISRTGFGFDEILSLHERSRAHRTTPTEPLLLDLLHWPLDSPELRFTPGAGFANRFGELFARANRPGVPPLQEGYLFDISVASDARPLFFELTRCSRGDTFGPLSACAALPWLVALVLAIAAVLSIAGGWRLQDAPGSRRAAVSLAAVGVTFALSYAFVAHTLSIFAPSPAHGVALAALGMLAGAGAGLGAGERMRRAQSRTGLITSATALVALALAATQLPPLLGALANASPGLANAFGLCAAGALGLALALPAGASWQAARRLADERSALPIAALALGAAVAVPAASALVLYADYNAVSTAAALALALPTMLALREARAD